MDFIKRLRRKSNSIHPGEAKNGEQDILTKTEIYWGFKVEKQKWLIDPMSRPKRLWDISMILFVFYLALTLPYELGFKMERIEWYIGISWFIDAFFLIDLGLSFLTTYQDPDTHFYVNDYRQVAQHYLRGWFAIDALCIFPFEIFAIGQGASSGWSKSLKNIRLLRINKVLKQVKGITTSEISNVVRLGWMLILFCLIIHWGACIFAGSAMYLSGGSVDDHDDHGHDDHDDHASNTTAGTGTWIEYYEEQGAWESVPYSRYVAALYWSAMTVTTVGYGDIVSQNDAERVINAILMVIGALIYAVIFGNISLYVANLNRDETNYQEAVGALVAHMKDISLPMDLQRKVLAYHDYVWSKNRGEQGNRLGDIPQRVQVEVAVVVHGRMIKSNTAFSDAPVSFINAAALALRFTVCLPNEYVYRERETAEDIYYIARGQVGVFRDGIGSMTVMKHGAHFGEIPMLLVRGKDENGQFQWFEEDWLQKKRERKKGSRLLTSFRVQSVRGYAYCDLWKMDYESFAELLNSHPLLREKVLAIARERITQKKWYDDEALAHRATFKVVKEQQKRKRGKKKRGMSMEDDIAEDISMSPRRSDSRLDIPSSISRRNSKGLDILMKLQENMEDIADKVDVIERRSTDLTSDVASATFKKSVSDRKKENTTTPGGDDEEEVNRQPAIQEEEMEGKYDDEEDEVENDEARREQIEKDRKELTMNEDEDKPILDAEDSDGDLSDFS